MANPQTEHGYLKIANEIMDALIRLDIHGADFRLIFAVIRKSWGWRRKDCEASLIDMVEVTGLSRSAVKKSKAHLLRRNILFFDAGNGRGNISKWRFNKDYDSWIKGSPEKPLKKGVTTVNGLLQEPLYGPTGDPFLSNQYPLSAHKPKKTKKQLSPKNNIKNNIQDKRTSSSREKDESYEIFAETFEREIGTKYSHFKGDFVQLAKLRKNLSLNGKGSPEKWKAACQNYCRSPMNRYSLADLCSRYAVFARSALDRFGKPLIPEQAKQQPGKIPASFWDELDAEDKRDEIKRVSQKSV